MSSVSFARWKELNEENIRIEFCIADNQPGVLFGLKDLTGLLNAVLENVVTFLREPVRDPNGTTEPLWLRFSFMGLAPDQDVAVLQVHDNIPFANPLVPSGGLKQVEEHCRIYGTIFQCSPELYMDSSLRMSFYFRIVRSGRFHGPAQS